MEAGLRRRTLAFSGLGAAAVLALLAAANLLSYQLFGRADFSARGAYSISRGTKGLLRGLKDNLVIKVYYTPRLPPPYGLDRQYLKDLLAEYRSAGRGRVRVEFLDPEAPKVRREAVSAGVAPLQLSVMGRDKFEVKESFMGVVFLYRGKSEVIPVLNGTADLEYDLTRRIKKLASDRTRTVGFVTGHGEAVPEGRAYAQVFDHIREQVAVETVSLAKPVPAGIDALWIWGPAGRYAPAELEALKAWLASGRTLGILYSRRGVDFRSFGSRPLETGLEPLLADWGLEVRDGFVADAQCEKVQMESALGMFRAVSIVDYPFIPVATAMNRGHPAARGLDAVSFPFAHPIRLAPGSKRRYTSLVDSSPSSWLRTDDALIPGTPPEALVNKDAGPFSLAGVLEGDAGRVLIIGTSKQAMPEFAGKNANLSFLLNLLEWSLQDETLLSIRSKGTAYRPLRSLPAAAALLLKYSLMLVPPLALAGAGFWIMARRRAQRRRLAQTFDAS